MSPIITLTTDFGLSDAYVAEMKGVILGINPGATIIDVCHTIKPQSIMQAGFVLNTAYHYFAKGVIHVAVVDPGVGSRRRAILLHTPEADFIAPDNGVLSYIIQDVAEKPVTGSSVRIKAGVTAISLTKSKYWMQRVSATFHGRDIIAPVAAHLSLGTKPEAFGEKVSTLSTLPLLYPRKTPTGLSGHVLHVDNFGNLITNICNTDLPAKKGGIMVTVGSKRINGVKRTYAEGSGLLALVGSHGYLEVSLHNGNASDFIGVGVGDQVRISFAGGKE